METLQQKAETWRQSAAEAQQACLQAENQARHWESTARDLTRERDALMQSLYDLQADLTAHQQRQQQQTRLYDQMLMDLLHRHAEEVDFAAPPPHVRRASALPRLLAWCRRQMPVSLPPALQFVRPQLHKLLIGINPVAKVVARSTFFDSDWYRAQYPEAAALGAHPAYHYTVIGAQAGHDPGPWFSTRHYLALHPELAREGVNALYHFETEGRKSGRLFGPHNGMTAAQARHQARAPALPAQEKARHVEQAQSQLRAFLAGADNRLAFPPHPAPSVSIVVVLFNNAALTLQCLMSVHEHLTLPLEVIVVDNASTDETSQLLERLQGCTVLRQQENLHFLHAANLGARTARGRNLLFLNNDTTLRSQALSAACEILDGEPGVGAVGGQILLLDGSLQEAGSILWQDGSTSGYGRGADPLDTLYQFQRDVDYCSGAFLMVKRAVFDQLGGFDPLFAPAYYEDVDLCVRISEAGWRVVYSPRIQIDHVESASYGADGNTNKHIVNNRERFKRRHAARLQRACAHLTTDELYARLTPGRYPARLLFVDDCWPLASLGSGFPRAYEFLAALCETGIFVTHYATSPGNTGLMASHDTLTAGVERAGGGQGQLISFLQDRQGYYDCLVVSRPHNMRAVSAWLEQHPDEAARLHIIYDAEAIASLREQLRSQARPGSPAPSMSLQDEISLTRKADTIIAVNEAEANMFRGAGRADVRVLGHCVDLHLSPAPFESRANLLFVGRLAEMDSPNVDAIEWFIEQIMPLLDRQLGSEYGVDLVGLCADELRQRYAHHAHLRFHGRIDDLEPFYNQARVFIAPARFAAGVPLKVYEAAAHGVPVVASSLLGRQLSWFDGEDMMLADSPQEFADACAALYHNASRWSAIREAAAERVQRECGRQEFRRRVQGLLAGLLTEASAVSLYADESAAEQPGSGIQLPLSG
ncbi:MAG: glycosyltransferase [Ottowia sp.]|uniref:glycosyltransferase n=1 Tax=Ottowia sp. TaxID=1898956 RepID=UPI003C7919A0